MKPATWLFGLLALPLAASNPAVQVADINTQVMGSVVDDFTLFRWPAEIVAGDSQIWFTADDGIHGEELWVTDGTAAGTRRIADICPGACSSAPSELTVVGSRLFLAANDGAHGFELWVTEGGTSRLVADLSPGLASGFPRFLRPFGNQVVFRGRPTTGGAEWWISDGTPAGTRLLVGAAPGTEPRPVGELAGRYYFAANDGVHGVELWSTDGTPEGTQLLRDLFPGSGSGLVLASSTFDDSGAVAGGRLYFTANDGVSGAELWATDGSAEGTVQVADLAPGPDSLDPSQLLAWGSRVAFVTRAPLGGRHLWISDGTRSGTFPLTPEEPSLFASARPLAASGSTLYFVRGDDVAGSEIWVSEGTPSTTRRVIDLRPGSQGSLDSLGTGAWSPLGDGRLIFHADDGVHGAEPWVTDGSEVGTRLLGDLRPGPRSSFSTFDFALALKRAHLGNVSFFFARSQQGNWALWRSDGTEKGTYVLTSLNRQTSSIELPPPMRFGKAKDFAAQQGGGVYFRASDNGIPHMDYIADTGGTDLPAGTTGPEPWRTDGTLAGTQQLADLQPGPVGSRPSYFEFLPNNLCVFAATAGSEGEALWRTDGTSEGTQRVASLGDSPADQQATGSLAFGERVLYGSWTGSEGWLMSTDGRQTEVLATSEYPPELFRRAGDQAYFLAGRLAVTDGTTAGTRDLASVGVTSFATRGRDALFWQGGDSSIGDEPWITDGSTAGTANLIDLRPGSEGSLSGDFLTSYYRRPITAATPTQYFFAANDGVHGEELWVSDGTAPGTFQPLDILPGPRGSEPRWLTAVGDRVYFVADDGVHGREPWVSDGTVAGTRLVADLNPGPGSSVAEEFLALDERVAFSASDGRLGRELWISGGGPTTTLRVADIHPGPGSSSPTFLTLSGPELYFAATDGVTGFELWKVPVAKLPEPDLFADGFESGATTAWSLVSP